MGGGGGSTRKRKSQGEIWSKRQEPQTRLCKQLQTWNMGGGERTARGHENCACFALFFSALNVRQYKKEHQSQGMIPHSNLILLCLRRFPKDYANADTKKKHILGKEKVKGKDTTQLCHKLSSRQSSQQKAVQTQVQPQPQNPKTRVST